MPNVAIIVLSIIGLTIGGPLLTYSVFLRFCSIKSLQKIACKWGWHSHHYNNWHKAENDPLQFLDFATCQWCGFEGQVDSQGNLY